MQVRKCFVIAITAGTALSATAFGQLADSVITNAEAITINQIQGGGYLRSSNPYAGRADLEVYQIGVPSETGGVFAGSGTNVYDDATFGGPYTSNANPLVLNGMGIGFILPAVLPDPNGDNLYTRVTFYPNHDTLVADPATPYSGTPTVIATLNWGAGWAVGATAGSVRYYAASITFNGTIATLTNADVFNGGPTDRTAGVKIEPYLDAAFTIRAENWQVVRRAGMIGAKIGSTDSWGWFSTAANVASGELNQNSRSGGGAFATIIQPNVNSGNCRASYMGFQGTGFVVTPPNFTDLGTLGDGVTTSSVQTGDVKWYKFTISAAATDNTNTFIDFDNEGATGDYSLALYNGNEAAVNFGSVIDFDADTGSGTNAMLSYGMGRRAAVGDGRQYDGRNTDGTAGLAAGTYYVAIAPAGSSFAGAFSVTPTTLPAPATSPVNIRTNVNGAPLAPSVVPQIAVADDFSGSDLLSPGVQFAAAAINENEVRWIAFKLCQPADDTNPVTLDWTGTDVAGGASASFFDASGNLVNQVTYAGTGLPPQNVFNSSNPLPAGTLYMAQYYAGIQIQPNSPATNGRWHVRGTTPNNGFAFGGGLLVNYTECAAPCPGNACGNQDYNGDGDFGTDQDIEAFFACLGGNCCATCFCQGSDFNGDGDFGTDQDIEAFFRVLGGGNC